MIILKEGNASVTIDGGELVGYAVGGHEYIHQKGSPGWRSSDTEMFPIIGPTADAGYQVQTPRDVAIQDQHGLLREMKYDLVSHTATKALFIKRYVANTKIKNSKYPDKSPKEMLFWPYDFAFSKRYQLTDEGLEIGFHIAAPRDSPFMLGYHPAFKLHSANPVVIANEKTITLAEILAVGSRAYQVADCEKIILKDAGELQIRTEGFGHFMLWTEVPNMLCIEPITFYPYAVPQTNLHEGFQFTKEAPVEFKVILSTTPN